jgi:NAD(P)-dependent dehydrogenase (short-subunit alcohol dehydrogenase family)
MRLTGKTAMITGGAGGIGVAVAKRFIAEGANVMIADLDEQRLAGISARLGPNAGHMAIDVTDPQSGRRLVAETLVRFGSVDVALLNAGIEGPVGLIPDTPLEAFDQVMAVNVRSVWIGLAALMPAMRQNGGGSIVITSSTAGMRGHAGMAPYSTSKHALIGLMRSAALEGAPHNIRVNTIHPAPIDTRMIAAINAGRNPSDPSIARKAMESTIALKRYGTVEEVAALILYLASDEASYCTGAMYPIDGGLNAGTP